MASVKKLDSQARDIRARLSAFEVAMYETMPPSRYLAFDYLDRRTPAPEPPLTLEEVRRELGWALIAAERQTHAEADERN